MGDELGALFLGEKLLHIQVNNEDQIAVRGDDSFRESVEIWSHVIETLGPTIVAAGFLILE